MHTVFSHAINMNGGKWPQLLQERVENLCGCVAMHLELQRRKGSMDSGGQLAISDIEHYQRSKKKQEIRWAKLEDFLVQEGFKRGFKEKCRIWIGEELGRRHGSKTFGRKANLWNWPQSDLHSTVSSERNQQLVLTENSFDARLSFFCVLLSQNKRTWVPPSQFVTLNNLPNCSKALIP